MDMNMWLSMFEVVPTELTTDEKAQWQKVLNNVALSSDAFFPFRDNVDRAHLVSLFNFLLIYVSLTSRFTEWCTLHCKSCRIYERCRSN